MKKWFIFAFLILILPQIAPQETPEIQLLNLINAERVKAGLSPLSWNQTLADVASAHSRDMIEKRYFSHVSREGTTPWKRVTNSGYYQNYRGFMLVAENIEVHSGAMNISLTHSNLMRSPGHKRNILSQYANEVGIGFAVGQLSYGTYTFTIVVCTQIFAYHSR
jgi:uncharacterized protein YkwD